MFQTVTFNEKDKKGRYDLARVFFINMRNKINLTLVLSILISIACVKESEKDKDQDLNCPTKSNNSIAGVACGKYKDIDEIENPEAPEVLLSIESRWIKPLTSIPNFSNNSRTSAVAIDHSSNVISVGFSHRTYGSFSYANAFLMKQNSAGDVLWSQHFGTNAIETANALVIDSDDNIYVAGRRVQAPDTLYNDAFVRKYDQSGELLWDKQFGSGASHEVFDAISLGPNNHILIGGYTTGNLAGFTNQGSDDAILMMIDNNGNVVWKNQFGTSGMDFIHSISSNDNSSFYVTGTTTGILDGVDFGNPIINTSIKSFISKYDNSGSLLWRKIIGAASGSAFISSSCLDSSGHLIVAGQTNMSINGEPVIGGIDGLIIKYDSSGNAIWTKILGTTKNSSFYSITCDTQGNSLATGYSQSPDLDELLAITVLSDDGTNLFSHTLGEANSTSHGYGIAVNDADEIVVVGEGSPYITTSASTINGGFIQKLKIND